MQFYDKISPVIQGRKFSIPSPRLCPTCRTQRRLSYRNDRSLYKTECAMSHAPILSMYNPQKGYTVYEQKTWRSDQRDPTQYAQEFDTNRSFFDQYHALRQRVPRFNVYNLDTENCTYVNYAPHCKNCYLIFGSRFNEECYYGQTLNECKNCCDVTYVDKSEYCYENVDCNNNYNAFFCQDTSHATNSYFCFDCENISHCIGCYNLRNKEYHIFNVPVSKEEFEQTKEKLSSYATLQEYKNRFEETIRKHAIWKAYKGQSNENVSGDFIYECKDIKECFSVYRSQDLAFCARMFDGKDSYDFDGGGKSELTYENMSNDFSYFSIGCTTSEHLNYSHYCDLCFDCEYCFGCVGLRKKSYCILNKQYTKEEYEKLVPQIIEKMEVDGERGEFPSGKYSPFAYNETMAYEYFPLTKDESSKRGYTWKDDEQKEYIPQTYAIPDTIAQVADDVVNQVLQCELSKKNYKITIQELQFYRKMNLPLPRIHPDQRHLERMKKRTPRHLWERNCAKC